MSLRQALHFFLLATICILEPGCPSSQHPPPPPAPDAPTNLVLTPISTCQIRLDWTDVASNEDHYIVERSLDGTTFTQIAILTAGTVTYNDLGLQPSSLFFYQVSAVNRGGRATVGPDIAFTPDLEWKGPITGGPGVRSHHAAVYDVTSQRMIVFGGATPSLKNDLWQLDLSDPTLLQSGDWSPITALPDPVNGTPSPRAGHSAVYDEANNRVIVFGGQDASDVLAEVWVLTLGASPAWKQVLPSGAAPIARAQHSAVYDSVHQSMIIYGGSDTSNTPLTDFGVLTLPPNTTQFSWSTTPYFSMQPVRRQWHSAIFDTLGRTMVVFGGLDNDAIDDGTSTSAETWTLTPGAPYSWTKLFFPSTPSPRQGHTAVYDSLNRKMLILGGGDWTLLPFSPPDFWSMDLDATPSWSALFAVNTGPAKLQHHSAVYDALNHRMVVYGGETFTATSTAEVWWIAP
jgi:hypothetical protein